MHNFVIGFNNPALEQEYLLREHETVFVLFKQISIPLLIIEGVYMIEGLMFSEYLVIGYSIAEVILIFLALYFGKMHSMALNLMICAIQCLHFANETVSIFMSEDATNLEVVCVVYSTAYMLQLQYILTIFRFQIGSRYSLKMLVIIANSSTQLVLYQMYNDIDIEVFIELLIFTIYMLYHIYITEKQKWELFRLGHNIEVLEDDVIQHLDVSCVRVKYITEQLQIKLIKSNKFAKDTLNIQDQQTFLDFIRTSKIQQGNLENFEIYLFNLMKVIGQGKKQNHIILTTQHATYSVQIIQFFNETPCCWIILNTKDQRVVEMRHKMKDYIRAMVCIKNELFEHIRQGIIKADNLQQQRQLVLFHLYAAYNWCLNINIQFNKQLNPIQSFRLDKVIEQCIMIFKKQNNSKTIRLQCSPQVITQDQEKVQQLLINLLFIFYGTPAQIGTLNVEQIQDYDLQIKIIVIHLHFNQNYRIPNNLLYFIKQILRLIGPYNEIQYQASDTGYGIKVYIFQNLRVMKEF